MALLWADGFDHYGTNLNTMLDGVWAEINSNWSLSAANPRTGTHSLRYSGSLSSGTQIVRRIFGSGLGTVGFGHAFYMENLPTSNDRMCLAQFRDINNAAQLSMQVLTTGAIRVERGGIGGTQLAQSADGVVTANAYQHFECKVTIHDSAGAVEVRINGVAVIDETGLDTQATAEPDTRQVVVGKFGAATTNMPETYFDDMIAWDASGPFNNDFLGDRRVRLLLANQDTVQDDWSPVGSVTGFEAIDDAAPDNESSYIAADEVGDISEFEFDDLPDSVSAVAALVVIGRLRKTDAGECNVQMSLVSGDIGSPPSPAVVDGADRPITEVWTYWQDVFESDPATGAPWTRDAVNAALLRVARAA